MILNILTWIQLKRDFLEIWLLNGTVAFVSLTNIQAMASLALIGLTMCYTAWKWANEIKEKKKQKCNENEGCKITPLKRKKD